MRKTALGPMLLAAALAAGCSSIETSSESNPKADLSRIRTWAWMEGQDGGTMGSPTDREHVTAAVAESLGAGLAERGLAYSGTGVPDAYVAFRIDLEHVVRVMDYYTSVGTGWTWRGFHGRTVDVKNSELVEYEQGTLVVDVVDAKTGMFLWRGTAKAVVDPDTQRADKEKLARAAATKVAKEFPGR